MANRRATQFPGAMPEEIAFARRRVAVRRASLRPDGALFVAVVISLVLLVPPVLVGWRVSEFGGLSGFALAVLAGGVISVLVTLLAARAWLHFSSGDRLFVDATLTGWVRRGRAERQIAIAHKTFDDPKVATIPLHVDRLIRVAGSVEARDARTHRHSGRVALHAAGAGKRLGLNSAELKRLKAAAKLHDVGALREPVWLEPTPEERLALALAGADLVEFTGDRRLIAAMRHQNENFDGSGLPDGLSGDAIPLTARIIAVADAYDTVARERGQIQAIAELNAGAGSKFDPDVVEAFIADAHASPVSALRGALAGMVPRASQGAVELLRGSASIAAAASIATTAVVATGVGAPPPARGTGSAASTNPAAVAQLAPSATTRSNSTDSDKGRRRAGNKPRDPKSDVADGKQEDAAVKNHAGQPGSTGTGERSGGNDAPTDSSAPEQQKVPAVPVQQLTDNVGQTIDNTTNTVDQVVTEVTDTVDQTTQQVGGTVDQVVGGLTGKNK